VPVFFFSKFKKFDMRFPAKPPRGYMLHYQYSALARHPRQRAANGHQVNTVYVIVVITSLNCGVEVLCFRAVESDSRGAHAQTYPTLNDCFAGLKRVENAPQNTRHPLDLRCVPEESALPFISREFK
jgi:hypothetical protein